MTAVVEPVKRAALLAHAVAALRAAGCDCQQAVNRSDSYAGIEPCDVCGALAILRADPDRPRYPTF